jgi:FKBP-type peptidyl-prolyl cis-trans isomerase FklB
MKIFKLLFLSMVGSAFVLSCANEEEGGIEIKTFEDSLAYDFGAANSDLKTIAVLRFEVDTTCMDRFVKGMKKGVEKEIDTAQIAYNRGMKFSGMIRTTADNYAKSYARYDSTMVLSAKLMVDGILDGYSKKADIKKSENYVNKAFEAFNANDKGYAVDYDTLSYNFGVANSDVSLIAQNMFGVSVVYMGNFIEGLKKGISIENGFNKQYAYASGEEFGQMVRHTAKQLKDLVFEEGSDKTLDVAIMLQGILDGYNKAINVDAAKERNQHRMETIEKERNAKKYAANKTAGEKFLAENAKKAGVTTTKSGLQYKVLVEGKGAVPTDASLVKVKYEGRFINGEVFDSNLDKDGTLDVKMEQSPVIQGWMEVLKLMPEGSKWEVYLPYNLAYGEHGSYRIEPFSALIFTIEIIDVIG